MDSETKIPVFSIVIPCFNHGHYLSRSVDSVLKQSFSNWELIIVNDGSTDHTRKIAEEFVFLDHRIKLISQENRGLSAARNSGINTAKGKVINFLDADDWLFLDCLEKINETFERFDADVLVSGYSYFFESEIIHTHVFHTGQVPLLRLFDGNIGPPVSFFVRRAVIDSIGGFDSSLKSCEDWDYWIRVVKSGFRIYSVSEVLVAYRYVLGSMSKNSKQMYAALCEVSARIKTPESLYEISEFDEKCGNVLEDQNKKYFIKCLGINLFQGDLDQSIIWYKNQIEKENWSFSIFDWQGLSSNLSFKYFLTPKLTPVILKIHLPQFRQFFTQIGYDSKQTDQILEGVFSNQLKMNNHLKYGKWFGGMMNKLFY